MAVVNLPYYAPIVLAKALTTIDHLSGGRLDAGLGIGWSPEEFAAVGTPQARRGARAEDYLRCLRAVWEDEVVEYEGEFYRVPHSRVDPKPLQRPHPPILLGGTAEPALRRAGRDPDELRFVCRGVVKVRAGGGERAPLVGSLDDVRADLADLAAKGVTEVFVDLNFDPEIGSPDADPAASLRRASEVLEALAPG